MNCENSVSIVSVKNKNGIYIVNTEDTNLEVNEILKSFLNTIV